MQIRSVNPPDLPAIVQVIHAAFEEYRGVFDPPSGAHAETVASIHHKMQRGAIFVAEMDQQMVGCVICEKEARHVYIGRLAVLPEYRGRGIARQLLIAAEEFAREIGFSHLQLGVRIMLAKNQQLFLSMGYEVVSYEAHPGASKPTYVVMEKSLK